MCVALIIDCHSQSKAPTRKKCADVSADQLPYLNAFVDTHGYVSYTYQVDYVIY